MSAIAQPSPQPRRPSAARRDLLREHLVRETLDGRPLYYADYKTVLASRKTAEEITGFSSLQWVVASYFMRCMILNLDRKKYWFATNEAGVHLDHRNNPAHDVAIYEKPCCRPPR